MGTFDGTIMPSTPITSMGLRRGMRSDGWEIAWRRVTADAERTRSTVESADQIEAGDVVA